MDKENSLYLHNMAIKVQYYHNIRKKAVKYIADRNLINDKELCVSVMLISALWAANKRQETLTEDDMMIFFGLETADKESYVPEPLSLSEEHKDLTLRALQDLTVQSYKG